jgi:glycosyltransferase 2 family protein
MKWNTIKKFFPIIGVGLFIYLIIKLNLLQILQTIEKVNVFYLLIAFGVTIIFFVTQTLKWSILAIKQKINIPFWEAFKVNLISSFYGFVTPSKLGSIMRIGYLKKYKADTGKGLSNFVIDKVLDLTSLFVLTLGLGFIFYGKKISSIISSISIEIIIGVFLVLVCLSLLFYKKENSRKILSFFYKIFIPKKFKEKGKEMFNSFYEDMPRFSDLFLVFIVNLINWMISYAIMYFIGLSLGVNIGIVPFLIILPIATVVAQIPITINGLGTREITMISLFGIFGISAVTVFSMSILGIIIANVIPSLIAMIFILSEKKNEIHDVKESR